MLLRLISFFLICSSAFSADLDPASDFYREISDIYYPTYEELRSLQNKILHTHRPILDLMPQTGFIPREFRFIGDTPETTPSAGIFAVNCSDDDRENCIIIYSSFNERYLLGLNRLLEYIKKSDYKGHVHYRIGGWPNIELGDIRLAHVPFAFKPCFFQEVRNKGYKKVLWLDSSILPSKDVSLNFVFDIIARIGFFIQAGDHTIGQFMNEQSAAAFGITLEETFNVLSCSAAIIGIDFTKPRGASLINDWYTAAHDPYAFFSDRSDQNALSILIHKKGLVSDLIPRKLLGSLDNSQGAFFIMDRSLVKDR